MAPAETSRPVSSKGDEGEDDDYLTMSFDDPSTNPRKKESLIEQKRRKQREAEIRGRPKSKKELAAEEAAKREAALATSTLDTSNKGYKMMAALGYKAGSTLGAGRDPNAMLEPVGLEMKEGRSGIGADSEKKRKFREEVERKAGEEKRVRAEEGDFRERNKLEREEKRKEAQVVAAQKVCERLDEEDQLDRDGIQDGGGDTLVATTQKKKKPSLGKVNVLWRGLVKYRAVKERDRRMRYDLHQSLTRTPAYDDPDEDREDRIALGKKDQLEEVDLDLDQEDEELDAFEALEPAEKLSRLVKYLRERWLYCFWCKYRYPDKEMEGCPGTTEEDHD
jgi:hypothetical protein